MKIQIFWDLEYFTQNVPWAAIWVFNVLKLYPSNPIKEDLQLIECIFKSKSDLRWKTSLSQTSIISLIWYMFNSKYFIAWT